MIGSAALDRQSNDLPGLFVGFFLHLLLDLFDLHCSFVADLRLHGLQKLLLCLLLGQTGEFLQCGQMSLLHSLGFLFGSGDLCHTAGQFFFLMLKVFSLFVQGFFLLLQSALLLAQLGATLFCFTFVLCAGFMDFVFGFQKHFLFAALTAADGFVDQAGGLCLCRADLPLGKLLAVNNTETEAYADTYGCANDDQNDRQ